MYNLKKLTHRNRLECQLLGDGGNGEMLVREYKLPVIQRISPRDLSVQHGVCSELYCISYLEVAQIDLKVSTTTTQW